MKIVLLSRFFPYIGGRERVVLSLSQFLAQTHKVTVASPDIGIALKGLEIVGTEPSHLRKYLTRFRPDIINSHTYYLTPNVLDVASEYEIPVCLTIHTDILRFGTDEAKSIFRSIAKRVDCVITVSNHGYQQMINDGLHHLKVKRIYSGIDPTIFDGKKISRKIVRPPFELPVDKFIFATPARMTPNKGIEVLIDAIQILPRKIREKMLFWIITPASRNREDEVRYAVKILELAERRNLDQVKMSFAGFTAMPFSYKAADAFILPSLTEEFPVSILEAMASKLPIIATNVGGVKEAIGSGAGSLVSPNNPEELSNAILRIFQDRDEARRLSIAGRRRVLQKFTLRRMCAEYMNTYREICKDHGNTGQLYHSSY